MFGWGSKKEDPKEDPNAKFEGKNIKDEEVEEAKKLNDEDIIKDYEEYITTKVEGNEFKVYRKARDVTNFFNIH